MSEMDIIRKADEQDRVWLSNSARYVVYRYALERDWITQDEHDAAQRHYGNLWNYTGD